MIVALSICIICLSLMLLGIPDWLRLVLAVVTSVSVAVSIIIWDDTKERIEKLEKALAEQIAHRFTSRVSEILESDTDVKCKECEYLMFSDCYGECRKGYKGIVSPNDSCGKGKRKGGEG